MNNAQYRYLDGALYKRDSTPYAHDLRIHDLGAGQVEATAMPRYAWTEVDASAYALETAAMAQGNHWDSATGAWVRDEPTEADLLDKAAANRERSTRRARTAVRRLIKAKLLTTMLTLTYKANMQDRGRMGRDFDVYMKRVRRLLPGFEYVCVFERQKRGAWHAHLAVQNIPSHYVIAGTLVRSYDLLRRVWRAVVGEGNIDVSRALRKRQRSISKLAGYLSKYIGKGFAEGQEGDSYRASGKALPKPTVVRSMATEPNGAVQDLVRLITAFWPAGEFYGAHLDGGGYYCSLSP